MTVMKEIARHFRAVYTGPNWTSVSLKEKLADVTWQEATTKVHNLNTIAALVFHINYYVHAVLQVMLGGSLNASDKFSFDLTPITSEEEWQQLVAKAFSEADRFAELLENFDEPRLLENFEDGKYGNYFRNIVGLMEHTYYHLGQISLVKKMVREG